jgi:single-strand DNA-binding protein
VNQLNLIGRMTRDPEDFGNPVIGVRFSVATEDYDFGTRARETEFHDCVAFGKTADRIRQYAEKGREVRVTGKSKTRKYTPTKGPFANMEIEKKNVLVDEFELLAGRPAGQTQATPQVDPNALWDDNA